MNKKLKDQKISKLCFMAIVLGVSFIDLKLTNLIAWSWWAVLSPIYIWLILRFLFTMGVNYILLKPMRGTLMGQLSANSGNKCQKYTHKELV